jgi:hypothetical protein
MKVTKEQKIIAAKMIRMFQDRVNKFRERQNDKQKPKEGEPKDKAPEHDSSKPDGII